DVPAGHRFTQARSTRSQAAGDRPRQADQGDSCVSDRARFTRRAQDVRCWAWRRKSTKALLAGERRSPRRTRMPEWIGAICPARLRVPTLRPRVTAPVGLKGTIDTPSPPSTLRTVISEVAVSLPRR